MKFWNGRGPWDKKQYVRFWDDLDQRPNYDTLHDPATFVFDIFSFNLEGWPQPRVPYTALSTLRISVFELQQPLVVIYIKSCCSCSTFTFPTSVGTHCRMSEVDRRWTSDTHMKL